MIRETETDFTYADLRAAEARAHALRAAALREIGRRLAREITAVLAGLAGRRRHA